MVKLFIVLNLIITSAFAASGGGHVSELIAPFVNIFILLSFLVWKLKTPMSNYFKQKSADVSEVMERASVKAREAEMMLQMQKTKLEKLDEEVSQIGTETEKLISTFKRDYEKSIEDRIQKLKADASQKIESEKKEMMEKVNATVLDEVIARAKAGVRANESLSKNITENLIQG